MTPDCDDPPPPPLRMTLAVAGVIVVTVAALVMTGLLRSTQEEDRSSPASDAPPSAAPTDTFTDALASLVVLHNWDRSRSRAWASGDVAALRRIYLPGSSAGAHDVAMLRRWVERGLRVHRMSMQVLSVELRVRSHWRIVLDVTDRLADAVAVPAGGGAERLLPRDGLTTRRLAFRLVDGRWLLGSAYERPLASTASMSGSENS